MRRRRAVTRVRRRNKALRHGGCEGYGQGRLPGKGEKKLTAAIDGKNMAYTVKTGLTPMLDKDAGETAYIFSASYILDGGPRERPVMFLFNGGPARHRPFCKSAPSRP